VLIVKFPVIVVVVYVATSLVNKDEYIDSSFRGKGSCPKGGANVRLLPYDSHSLLSASVRGRAAVRELRGGR